MQDLLKHIERTALDLVVLDATDLPGLAELHTLFLTIAGEVQRLDQFSQPHKQRIRAVSDASAALVEKVILQEIDNADCALKTLSATAQALQQLAQQIHQGNPHPTVAFPAELHLPDAISESVSASETNRPNNQSLPANVDPSIYAEFLATLPDTLDNFESTVLAAEKNPSPEHIDTVKAVLHNLKGEAGLMGLDDIATFCHNTESLIEKATKRFPAQKLLAAHDQLTHLCQAVADASASAETPDNASADTAAQIAPKDDDATEQTTESSAPEPAAADLHVAEADIPLVNDFINESNEHLEAVEADLLALEENPSDPETLNAVFRAFHTIKGVAGFLNLKAINNLAHSTENLLDLARKQQLSLTGTSMDVVFQAIDAAKTMLADLRAAVDTSGPFRAPENLASLIKRIKACAAGQNAPVPVDKPNVDPARADTVVANARKLVADSTVKVTTSRLDSLVNMVGELVIAQSMVTQGVSDALEKEPTLDRNLRHLDKITRELQELSMSMRMVPVQGVFQKMARLVRDLSRTAGKQIEFTMSGADTEVDRNVVEAVADPLVHMVRNSVDHGVESPDKRRAAGKDPTGHVELAAYHQGGNIVIEIRDDGNGLDREKILNKARNLGIIKEGQELSDHDTFMLIFHPGLSTAEKVTSISGRGVGMDVVRKNIESLRGRVDIQSERGKGTTFFIRLPLTLAVIDGQIVTVGSEKFIIPILSIEQSFRPTSTQLATAHGGRAEMVNIRGNLLPLVRLHRLFRTPPRNEDPTQGLCVVVSDGPKKCSLFVDDLLGQQQVVIKSLGQYLGRVPAITGGAIMGDGNVSLILDVPGLIALAQK